MISGMVLFVPGIPGCIAVFSHGNTIFLNRAAHQVATAVASHSCTCSALLINQYSN